MGKDQNAVEKKHKRNSFRHILVKLLFKGVIMYIIKCKPGARISKWNTEMSKLPLSPL